MAGLKFLFLAVSFMFAAVTAVFVATLSWYHNESVAGVVFGAGGAFAAAIGFVSLLVGFYQKIRAISDTETKE